MEFFKNTILRLESQQITTCLAIGLGTFTSSNPYGSPIQSHICYPIGIDMDYQQCSYLNYADLVPALALTMTALLHTYIIAS